MAATIGVISNIGSTLNSSITFTKFVFELKNTPKDVQSCLEMVKCVDDDLQYAASLRTQHLKYLSMNPAILNRLDRILQKASDSIFDTGRLLESCRPDAHGGQVPFAGKMKWVLGDSTAFVLRTRNLTEQHAAINAEIAYLRQLEMLQSPRSLDSQTTFENLELLSVRQKRSTSSLSNRQGRDLGSPPTYSPISSQPYLMPEPQVPVYQAVSNRADEYIPYSPTYPSDGRAVSSERNSITYTEECQDEDTDPETAFYKQLRLQEDERRKRRATRMNRDR
jgi:hypothetical protein